MFKTAIFTAFVTFAVCDQEILEKILERLDQHQKQIDTLQSIITSNAKEQVKYNVMSRKTESFKPSPETPIYFSASASATLELVADTIIIYDDIISNVGGLYASDGRFTCPVGGYYYFHISVKSDALRVAQVNIVLDDGTTRTTVASAMSVDGYDHASNGVFIECSAGNTVYALPGPSLGTIYGEAGFRYNVLSGGLLWVIQ